MVPRSTEPGKGLKARFNLDTSRGIPGVIIGRY